MRAPVVVMILLAVPAGAQVVATAGRHFVVAHDGRIELFDAALRRIWSVDGPSTPAQIVAGGEHIAVIDSFANEVRLVDPAAGRSQRFPTGETPVCGVFAAGHFYVLDRDAGRVEQAGGGSLAVAADPIFMRSARDLLYVYSRREGVIQEIAPSTLTIVRTLTLPPFASDFEVDGGTGYLVYPHAGRLRTFSLTTMKPIGDIAAGVVPVDLAVFSGSGVLTATRLAVADPAGRRVWIVEGQQSIARAVVRGFLRGLLGLGLLRNVHSDLPTGVDRVMAGRSLTLAYDTTTRTLYRLRGSKTAAVAQGIGPAAFTATDEGIVIWQDGALRLIR